MKNLLSVLFIVAMMPNVSFAQNQCAMVPRCDRIMIAGPWGDLSKTTCDAYNARAEALKNMCPSTQDVSALLKDTLSGVFGLTSKCKTVNGFAVSKKGYRVDATATVCVIPGADNAPFNTAFSCSASTTTGSANNHVDCGPVMEEGDERRPVPSYGAGTNASSTMGFIKNKKIFNVGFSGITAGDSIEGSYIFPIDDLYR